MPPEISAASKLIESGVLGAALVGCAVCLIYVVRQFIEYLKQLNVRQAEDNKEFRLIMNEHTQISKEMFHGLSEMNNNIKELGEELRRHSEISFHRKN